ncbi:MAG TPA: hypothetical protein VFL38_15110 [Humibacillus xanthopallidus]|nr:hypothetical protein [Humibacillus xanthopallidus]
MTATDEPDGHGSNGSAPATDDPARTVAEEAALLVELLSRRGWGAGGGMPSASSHTTVHEPGAESSSSAHRNGAGASAADDGAATDRAGAGARPGGIPLTDARQAPECTCGGREPAACRLCPVCQLISFVQQVNPDTIERVADFVGFAATALRDLATAQRERSTRPEAASPEAGAEAATRSAGARDEQEGPA